MRRLLLLAGLAVLLAACGGTANDAGPSEPATGPELASPAEAPGLAAPSPDASRPASPAERAPTAPPEQPDPAAAAEAVTVWVTRDAGAELMVEGEVEPGRTAIQSVSTLVEVHTRYGGRYVSEIDGLSSDLDGQNDWFFLVNGIEPDVGGAEVKVGAGDVVWWDYRGWADGAPHPAAVVGAFPRPFHRGWKGVVRPIEVSAPEELAEAAAELEAFLSAAKPDDPEAKPHRFVLEVLDGAAGAELSASMGSRNGSPVTFVLAGSQAAVQAAAEALIASPAIVTRRYKAVFDEKGQVLEP